MKVVIKNRRRIAESDKALTFTHGIGKKRIFNIPKSQILEMKPLEGNKTEYTLTSWIYKKVYSLI